MDAGAGDAALRNACARAVAVARHPQRAAEHAVLDRLYYKNRSQHRRAPYFHRLDRVRRVLRRVQRHRVWPALAAAADPARPLAFSSLTVVDAEDALALLALASARAVPAAATSVVAELVCRGHFVPFGVTVVALLARLYVVERQLAAELRAALTSMRVLLARGGAPGPSGFAHGGEDVGEPVAAEPVSAKLVAAEPEPVSAADPCVNVQPAAAGCCDVKGGANLDKSHTRHGERSGAIQRPVPPGPEQAVPSLYDLMAEEDPATAAALGEITGYVSSAAALSKPALPFGRPQSALQPDCDAPLPHRTVSSCPAKHVEAELEKERQDVTKVVDDDAGIDDIFDGLL